MAKPLCGVDIGSHSIKVVTRDGRAVRGLWQHTIFPERRSHRDALPPSQWEARIIGLLRKAARECPGWNATPVLALQGFGCRVGYLELPRLSGEQLDTAVQAAVGQELARGLQDTSLSYREVPSLHPDRMGLVWAASPNTWASRLLRVARQAGLSPTRLELPAVAVVRAIFQNHKLEPGAWYAIIKVGYDVTTLIMARDGIPYFSRNFWSGGAGFTTAAMLGYGCSWAEAELLKFEYDARSRKPIFECSVYRWLTEIQRTRLYAITRDHFFAPEKVFLCGGSALWNGLAERIGEAFGVHVVVEDWDVLKGNAAHPACHYTTALGLASLARKGAL